jgi:uncharacterized membrane protein
MDETALSPEVVVFQLKARCTSISRFLVLIICAIANLATRGSIISLLNQYHQRLLWQIFCGCVRDAILYKRKLILRFPKELETGAETRKQRD